MKDLLDWKKHQGLDHFHGFPKKQLVFDSRMQRSMVLPLNKDEKPRSFISNYLKVHSIDPGPCKYET